MRNIFLILFTIISINCFGYSISNAGKQHIKKYESCRLTAYWDGNGYSIGYGHHGKDVKKGMKISQAKAEQLFNEDIKKTNDKINRLISELPVKHKFSQKFIDGLGDLVYNCGENGVRQSEFWKRMMRCRKNNKRDFDYALVAVKTCRVSAKGHIARRQETYNRMIA